MKPNHKRCPSIHPSTQLQCVRFMDETGSHVSDSYFLNNKHFAEYRGPIGGAWNVYKW